MPQSVTENGSCFPASVERTVKTRMGHYLQKSHGEIKSPGRCKLTAIGMDVVNILNGPKVTTRFGRYTFDFKTRNGSLKIPAMVPGFLQSGKRLPTRPKRVGNLYLFQAKKKPLHMVKWLFTIFNNVLLWSAAAVLPL